MTSVKVGERTVCWSLFDCLFVLSCERAPFVTWWDGSTMIQNRSTKAATIILLSMVNAKHRCILGMSGVGLQLAWRRGYSLLVYVAY